MEVPAEPEFEGLPSKYFPGPMLLNFGIRMGAHFVVLLKSVLDVYQMM
jgi:hypothetical protein